MSVPKHLALAVVVGTSALTPTLLVASSPSSHAAEHTTPASRASQTGFVVPLVFKVSDGVYNGFGDDVKPLGYLPPDQALRKAAWVHVTRLSEPTRVVFADGSCLTNVSAGHGQRAAKRVCSASEADPRQLWAIGANSIWTSTPLVAGQNALTYALPDADGIQLRAKGALYTFSVAAVERRLPLGATVVSTDEAAGIAEITGTARPNSTLLVDDDDSKRVPVSSTGSWRYTASGVKPGLNRIQFDEYVGEWKSATTQVDATIDTPFRPLSITSGHVLPGTARTTITGTATPFATIGVTVFGVTETVTARRDGGWSYERGFNNAIEYRIDVTQTAGELTDRIVGWALGPADGEWP